MKILSLILNEQKLFKFLNLYEQGINKFYETAQNRKMISTPSYSSN